MCKTASTPQTCSLTKSSRLLCVPPARAARPFLHKAHTTSFLSPPHTTMSDLDALLATPSGRRLAPTPDSRLKCSLSGHVLPRRADAVAAYLK